ncbi:MAG: hypothetical protein OEN55_11245 [Alphaproteobacteria bacterium]|nr:hypothetical protein [Alphaproteobacteria bacterium]
MSALHNVCKTPPGQAVITLQGGSAALYGFTAFPLEDAPCGAAIYIFARPSDSPLRSMTSYWEPLLIGETGGMRDRSEARQERLEEARRLGATHMLIHFCGRGTDIRRRIVADLASVLSLPRNRVLSQPAAA